MATFMLCTVAGGLFRGYHKLELCVSSAEPQYKHKVSEGCAMLSLSDSERLQKRSQSVLVKLVYALSIDMLPISIHFACSYLPLRFKNRTPTHFQPMEILHRSTQAVFSRTK